MRGLPVALALALGLAPPALAAPPMWVARDADSEMVLFGSVHVLPPGLAWRSPALDTAVARADDIWFEAPIDQATGDAAAALARHAGILPPKRSLFAILPPDGAARLLRVADLVHADKQVLDRCEPWLAEVALSAAAFTLAGASDENGVDKILWAAAPPAAVRTFETPAQQIALLDHAPLADQIASLDETARQLEADPRQYDEVVRAWMAGDLAAIERQAFEPLRKVSPRLFKRLVTDRNARWARILAARLRGKGRTVVVVGMGHLVGREGLPARLRALGYSVTGP